MNIKLKMWIDSKFGYPLLVLMGVYIRFKKLIFKSQPSIEVIKTILITKYQGMGSLVIAAPAIRQLKLTYPQAKIIFLGTQSTTPLAEKMNEFDRVLVLKENLFSFLKVFFILKKEKLDMSFDLEVYSNLAAVLSTVFNAKKRIGFLYRTSSSRQHVYTDLVYFNQNKYLGRAYWKLFSCLNSEKFETEKLHDYSDWILKKPRAEFKISQKYVLLNIHASSLSLERKWPISYFEEWAKKFISYYSDHKIILIGYGQEEVEEVSRFLNHERIIKLAGLLNLDEVIYFIANAELVISNDSAPLHFANALGVRVVGLFGPTQAFHYFSTHRKNAYYLQKDTYCSPCVHHWDKAPCHGDNQCMKKITSQDLWNLTSKVLAPANTNSHDSVAFL